MSTRKAVKVIALAASTQEHHVSVKIKNIMRWLKSGYEVKVAINGKADRQKSMENVLKHIEHELKAGAEIKQKVIKPESIKFNIKPTPSAANYNVEGDAKQAEDINEIFKGKDLLSEDFEKELEESLKNDRKPK